MLIGTTGVIRTGKTTLDSILTVMEAEDPIHETPSQVNGMDFELFANYHVNHKKVKYLATPDEFTELEMDEMNGLCTIQEMQVWFESRGSSYNEVNKMVDKTVLQSGKLGFDILWDSQLSSSVDKRPRYMTLNWFATRRKTRKPLILRYMYINEMNHISKFHFTGKQFEKIAFKLFNTREISDLKRKWEQHGRPEGFENHTSLITQPNGEQLDALTPDIVDKPLDVNELIQNGITEIVS